MPTSQVLKNVRVTDKRATLNDEYLLAAIQAVEKDLQGSGRVLVRQSGTEPVVRVMVEAETLEKCEQKVEKIVEVIRSRGYERTE